MDRASDSGSEGWGFESLPVYQTVQIRTFYQLVKGSDLLFSFECGINALNIEIIYEHSKMLSIYYAKAATVVTSNRSKSLQHIDLCVMPRFYI